MAYRPDLPVWADAIAWLMVAANLGVPLFFVLSGYLIARQLDGGMPSNEFWLRRAAKIYPTYLLLIVFFVAAEGLSSRDAFVHLAAMQNTGLIPVLSSQLGHLWSVAVEIQFYLIAPFLLRTDRGVLRSFKVVIAYWLAVSVLLLGVAALWGWNGSDATDRNSAFILGSYVNFFTNAPSLLFGAWLYRIHEHGHVPILRVPALAVFIAVSTTTALCLVHGLIIPSHLHMEAMSSEIGFFAVLGMIMAFPIVSFACANALLVFAPRIRRWPFATLIALASYQWYLLHPLFLPGGALNHAVPQAGGIGVVSYILLSFVAAVGSFRLIEEPMRKLVLRLRAVWSV